MLERVFPAEVTGSVPCITLRGRKSILVEQHRGVVVYQPDEVAFKTAEGIVRIVGQNLSIVFYTAQDAQVEGTITGIAWKGGE